MTRHKRKQTRTLTSDSRGRITGATAPDTDYIAMDVGSSRLLIRSGNPLATPSFRDVAAGMRKKLDEIDNGIPLGTSRIGRLIVMPVTDTTRATVCTNRGDGSDLLDTLADLSPRRVVTNPEDAYQVQEYREHLDDTRSEDPEAPLPEYPELPLLLTRSRWQTEGVSERVLQAINAGTAEDFGVFYPYPGPQVIITAVGHHPAFWDLAEMGHPAPGATDALTLSQHAGGEHLAYNRPGQPAEYVPW